MFIVSFILHIILIAFYYMQSIVLLNQANQHFIIAIIYYLLDDVRDFICVAYHVSIHYFSDFVWSQIISIFSVVFVWCVFRHKLGFERKQDKRCRSDIMTRGQSLVYHPYNNLSNKRLINVILIILSVISLH